VKFIRLWRTAANEIRHASLGMHSWRAEKMPTSYDDVGREDGGVKTWACGVDAALVFYQT
jgi:hypothetical protein